MNQPSLPMRKYQVLIEGPALLLLQTSTTSAYLAHKEAEALIDTNDREQYVKDILEVIPQTVSPGQVIPLEWVCGLEIVSEDNTDYYLVNGYLISGWDKAIGERLWHEPQPIKGGKVKVKVPKQDIDTHQGSLLSWRKDSLATVIP